MNLQSIIDVSASRSALLCPHQCQNQTCAFASASLSEKGREVPLKRSLENINDAGCWSRQMALLRPSCSGALVLLVCSQ